MRCHLPLWLNWKSGRLVSGGLQVRLLSTAPFCAEVDGTSARPGVPTTRPQTEPRAGANPVPTVCERNTEATRLDEDAVSKTVARNRVGGSSPSASAIAQ